MIGPRETDPVERLLDTARGAAPTNPFRVTGVMMQYYFVCTRELWFASRHLEIDRDRPAIVRGTAVDESAYEGKRRNLRLGMVSIDMLDDGRVVEIKPSSSLTRPAEMQLSYYLWYLKHVVGIEVEGVLAHPRERNRTAVRLTPEREAEIERAVRGIHDVVRMDAPPAAERKPFCEQCAYHDLCWC